MKTAIAPTPFPSASETDFAAGRSDAQPAIPVEGDGLGWAIESLQTDFGILLDDLDRYAGAFLGEIHAPWFEPLLEDLFSFETLVEEVWLEAVIGEQSALDDWAGFLLEASGCLLERADEVLQNSGETRLALRLRALARAALEVARCVPTPLERESEERSPEPSDRLAA